jgi:hypothetical protein
MAPDLLFYKSPEDRDKIIRRNMTNSLLFYKSPEDRHKIFRRNMTNHLLFYKSPEDGHKIFRRNDQSSTVLYVAWRWTQDIPSKRPIIYCSISRLKTDTRYFVETKFGFCDFVKNERPTGDYVQYMSIDLTELSFSNSKLVCRSWDCECNAEIPNILRNLTVDCYRLFKPQIRQYHRIANGCLLLVCRCNSIVITLLLIHPHSTVGTVTGLIKRLSTNSIKRATKENTPLGTNSKCKSIHVSSNYRLPY